MSRFKINMILLVLIGTLSLFVGVNVSQAVDNHALIWTPFGTKIGSMMDSGAIYKVRSHANTAGTQYYISAAGHLWGKCSPDMTGCTANRWKKKDIAFNGKYWAIVTDENQATLSDIIYGIRVGRHFFQQNPSYSSSNTGYSSDQPNNGAGKWQCYYNGPGSESNPLNCP